MKGCGFGKISPEKFADMFLETFDHLSAEEKEAIRTSTDKHLAQYAKMEKGLRRMRTKIKAVK